MLGQTDNSLCKNSLTQRINKDLLKKYSIFARTDFIYVGTNSGSQRTC